MIRVIGFASPVKLAEATCKWCSAINQFEDPRDITTCTTHLVEGNPFIRCGNCQHRITVSGTGSTAVVATVANKP
jgi:DNA-directed RNA polymerase subunit RPC12/RpoP